MRRSAFVSPCPLGLRSTRCPIPAAPLAGDEGGYVEANTREPTRLLHELTRWALEQHIELIGLTVTRPTLEDMYLELTAPPA